MTEQLTYQELVNIPPGVTPSALLAKGECRIAAGRYREGSAAVYQAAFAALREVARRRGWPCETHEDADNMIYRLDGREPPSESLAEALKYATDHINDPPPVYSRLFIAVIGFKYHGATTSPDGTLAVTFWEPEDYDRSLPKVKKFIDLLASEEWTHGSQ